MPSNPAEIDRIIDTFVTRGFDKSPGCSLAVAEHGEIIHSKSYGMADLDHGIKNTPDTVFFAASLSKQFTAMSILLLSNEIEKGKGRFSLDHDVRRYIPELGRLPKVTIRQLLHHTSGIRDMLIQLTLAGWRWGDDLIDRQHVLDLASRMKTLNFPAGSQFAYSNTNYFLASEIVRRVSRQSLAEFAQENIFDPLGMKNTRFVDTYSETVKDRASGYRRLKDAQGFEKRTPNYNLTGPTNLYTTAEDLLLWDGNFDDKKHIVGGRDAIEALQTADKNSDAYGLGLYVHSDRNGKPLEIYHNGRTIGHRAHLYRDIQNEISIALLCNVEFTYVEATDDIVFAVSRAVQGLSPFRPTLEQPERKNPDKTTNAAALRKYCGIYYNQEINTAYEVKRKVGKKGVSLVVKRPKHDDCALVDFPGFPDDKFVAQGFTDVLREVEVTFLKGRKEKVTGLQLDWAKRIGGSRLMGFRFDKIS